MCCVMTWCGTFASKQKMKQAMLKTHSRGPDDDRIIEITDANGKQLGLMGFQRLSIMGLSPNGMQPFELNGSFCVCNGEIYGFESMRQDLTAKGYHFQSGRRSEYKPAHFTGI